MKQFFRILSGLTAGCAVILSAILTIAGTSMPDSYRISSHSSLSVTAMGMTAQIGTPSDQGELLANASSPGVNAQSNKYETQLMLFQNNPHQNRAGGCGERNEGDSLRNTFWH